MDEKFWASVKWRQSERCCFGSGMNGLNRRFWGRECQWLLGLWDSALWLCVWPCQQATSLPLAAPLPNVLHWVSVQGHWRADSAQPDGFHWTVGPGQFELLHNCWHCDLEPLVLEESSLLRATVGRGEQRGSPKRLSEVVLEAADHWLRGIVDP